MAIIADAPLQIPTISGKTIRTNAAAPYAIALLDIEPSSRSVLLPSPV
jgi:hypothetical protein